MALATSPKVCNCLTLPIVFEKIEKRHPLSTTIAYPRLLVILARFVIKSYYKTLACDNNIMILLSLSANMLAETMEVVPYRINASHCFSNSLLDRDGA